MTSNNNFVTHTQKKKPRRVQSKRTRIASPDKKLPPRSSPTPKCCALSCGTLYVMYQRVLFSSGCNSNFCTKEFWRKTFTYLSPEDLGRVARVCIEWRDVLDEKFFKIVFEQRFPAEFKKIHSKIKKNKKTQTDPKGWRDYYRTFHTIYRKPYSRSMSAHNKKRHMRTVSQDSAPVSTSVTLGHSWYRSGSADSERAGEEELKKEIMVWLVSELKKSFDLPSFSTGEPFLVLLHKYDSSIVDLETFDKSDRIKTLTTIFDLAEQHLNIPNLLDPHSVANNLSQKQLLLYLAIWKEKTENFEFF